MIDIDQLFIQKAIRLAKKGTGFTSPNPLVGAIVVKAGKIISQGFHKKYGGPHAEIFALEEADKRALGATLYVNLEPCCHYGKTPPCVDRVIKAGIARVVISNRDPNPLVNGGGIKKLIDSGIEVQSNINAKEGVKLNEAYFKYTISGKPFVILKWAQSIDGKIATQSGSSFWISNEKSRKYVHYLRKSVDAVLVGVGTINHDNPQLTIRYIRGKQPWRIILDNNFEIDSQARVLRDQFANQTVIFTSKLKMIKKDQIEAAGVKVINFESQKNGRFDLNLVLDWLAKKGVMSLMVEGGKEVYTSFIKARLVDKFIVFIAPKLFGKGFDAIGDLSIQRVEDSVQIKESHIHKLDTDIIVEAYSNEIPCSLD